MRLASHALRSHERFERLVGLFVGFTNDRPGFVYCPPQHRTAHDMARRPQMAFGAF